MIDTRVPPHSFEAEAGVLGGLLMGADALIDLRPEDFYRTGNGIIFSAFNALHSQGKPVDTVMVVEYLRSRGMLEKAGGAAQISELTGQVPSTTRVEHYAGIVRRLAEKRAVLYASYKAIENVHTDMEAGDILAEIEKAVSIKEEGGGLFSFQTVLADTYRYIGDACSGKILPGLESGFYDLDAISRGHPGDLIIIGGRPGMGKSAIGQNIAMHNAVRGKKGLFVTAEMSRRDLCIRALSAEARVEASRLREGKLRGDDFSHIGAAAGRLAEANLHFYDRAGPTVQQIRRAAMKLAREGLDFVVADYLQIFRSAGRRERRDIEVGEITAGMKGLAKELNIPVYLLAQLSRKVEERNPPKPVLADLRESGEIEQAADTVWFLYRPEYYYKDKTPEEDKGKGYVYIEKQRHGRLGYVELRWDGEHTSYRNMDRRGY